ncbi:hypothetical protein DB30_07419 [Enhygromyxa salina]|uniref:Tryptophan dimethylallyltransferase n=1 Tax=Enhygromyxa salina TaxID=215803 RepID=A0A0C1Z8H3_9BACT|nr:hypothetical protein DB30_07419 [Enhygromyxa salina]
MCDGVGFSAAQRDAAVSLMCMLAPWGERAIGARPAGQSDITDEHFPIEFSVAFEDGEPEIRVLFEAQADQFVQAELWRAGWEVCDALRDGCGVSLDRLHQIADLFEPTDPACRYAMWHCVCFSKSGPPKFKVYLNPLAQGAEQAPRVVHEALVRLGFSAALGDVFNDAAVGELRFFSLDLSAREDARVKVYRVHSDSTRDQISAWLRCVPSYDDAFVDRFWQIIAGDTMRFSRFPVSTYISLDSRSSHPNAATIHFPVRSYANDDLDAYNRIRAFMGPEEMALYDQALTGFAKRSLSSGVGLQAYVAVRIHPGAQHTTVYLSPEAYEVAPVQKVVREGLRVVS